ncbi:hypothetical protein GBAR_LOCUS30450, partial [Geodia barretti]
ELAREQRSPNISDVFTETKFREVEGEALDDDRYREVIKFRDEQMHTVSVYNDTVRFDANIGTNGTVFTLPADGEYKATIEDPIMACGTEKTKNFTTYDVQEPHAESTDGKMIDVNGELIVNSSAKGCFVANQCNYTTQITFIALKRNGTNQNLSMEISMPASNYTVYVHDLEKDGLPNIHPANLVPSSVEITHGEEKYKAPNGENLNNASISRHGSILIVTCTPDEHSALCVLVFRAYGNYMLNWKETFPVTVDLDPDMNYTFALFRRLDKDTDERPFVSMFIQGTEDPLQPQPPSTGTPERAKTTSSVVAVTVGVLVTLTIILLVPVSIIRYCVKKEETRKGMSLFVSVVSKWPVLNMLTWDLFLRQTQTLGDGHRTQCPYVTILPHATTPVNDNDNRGPPTVASVMSLLWGVAGHWKEIAKGLGFDEDYIDDEVDPNNDMDEGCLQVCVEIWVFKLQPSWEKLSHVLRDLGEVELARQAGNKEPQEQWLVPSRETSDSSSSGVVADASSQSTDFSSEVVLGVEKTVALDDGNNEDGSRGGKKTIPNDRSSGERGARSVFLTYPALHEEGPTVSESSEEDEETKCDVGTIATVESEEREKDDRDFAQDPVSTQGSDDDYHSESFSSGRQISAATSDTAKDVGRDFIPGLFEP